MYWTGGPCKNNRRDLCLKEYVRRHKPQDPLLLVLLAAEANPVIRSHASEGYRFKKAQNLGE
jgi:hypothetical protein